MIPPSYNSAPENCPHFGCEQRFGDLERRMEMLDSDWRSLRVDLTAIREQLGELRGKIAGYLVAATLLGTAVAFLAAYMLRNQG